MSESHSTGPLVTDDFTEQSVLKAQHLLVMLNNVSLYEMTGMTPVCLSVALGLLRLGPSEAWTYIGFISLPAFTSFGFYFLERIKSDKTLRESLVETCST